MYVLTSLFVTGIYNAMHNAVFYVVLIGSQAFTQKKSLPCHAFSPCGVAMQSVFFLSKFYLTD